MQGINAKLIAFTLTLLVTMTLAASPAFANPAQEHQAVVNASQQLNINQATAEQLISLPGVGPARAAAIIEMREQQGGFQQLSDLQQVRGIGPATLKELEPLVSF